MLIVICTPMRIFAASDSPVNMAYHNVSKLVVKLEISYSESKLISTIERPEANRIESSIITQRRAAYGATRAKNDSL
jgi:hypothetical protein